MSLFAYLSLLWSAIPCLASSSSCVVLSQVGLIEVRAIYLRSLGYFLACGSSVAEWLLLRKANGKWGV
jgi:hypothetical protein